MKGQAHRSTVTQLDHRISMCAKLLADGMTRRNITRFCRQEYKVTTRRSRSYIGLAQERIREDLNVARHVLVARSLKVYQDAIRNPKARVADIIKAQRAIDLLLGLPAPQQLQVSAAVTSTQQALAQIPWDAVARVQSQLAGVKPVEALQPPCLGPDDPPVKGEEPAAVKPPAKPRTPWMPDPPRFNA